MSCYHRRSVRDLTEAEGQSLIQDLTGRIMRYFYNIAMLSTLALLLIASPLTQAAAPAGDPLLWSELPELPPLPGQTSQPGLAGAFTGVHNDALILAGGANFPAGLPWDTLADGSKPRWTAKGDGWTICLLNACGAV